MCRLFRAAGHERVRKPSKKGLSMRTRNKPGKPLRMLDKPSTEVGERDTHQVRTFRRDKCMSAAVFAAAALALALGGLSQPAVSHAEKVFDKKSYESCRGVAIQRHQNGTTTASQALEEVKFCCWRSGGQLNGSRCEAAPMQGPPVPSDSPEVANPGPVVGGQNPPPAAPPEPAAQPAQPAPPPPRPGWGVPDIIRG